MCTVSWTAVRDGYDLFFNRDELNSRAAEEPPVRAECDGVAYLAPRDGEHGGTWLAVNESGLTICLLNDYGAAWRPRADQTRFSRGHLVRNCAAAANHADVIRAVHAQPLGRTSAFHLVALSPHEGALVMDWQGTELIRHDAGTVIPPLSSSSFATREVIAARLQRFASVIPSARTAAPDELARYHRQHDRTAGGHSVLMCRPDAATRSICRVTVDRSRVNLCYEAVRWNGREPIWRTPVHVTLARRMPAVVSSEISAARHSQG